MYQDVTLDGTNAVFPALVLCQPSTKNDDREANEKDSLSDTNTKRFKRTLIYFNTDTQYAIFGETPFIKPQTDTQTIDKRLKTMKNEKKKKEKRLILART